MKNGSITVNGISDKDLIKILEIKTKHEAYLNFTPNVLQPLARQQVVQQPARQIPGQPLQPAIMAQTGEQMYNNAVLGFTTDQGLEAVLEILEALTGKKAHHGH